MQTTEVTHTNELSGSSKFIRSAVAYRRRAHMSLSR